MSQLRPVTDEIWVAEHPLRFGGVNIGTRMTVVRLAGGALLVHSPVPADAGLRAELDRLGPVRFVVAPNRYHYLFFNDFAAHYSEAERFGAPRLLFRHPELAPLVELGDRAPEAWADQLTQKLMHGYRRFNEVVFLHRPTRTLIVADQAFHLDRHSPWPARLLARVGGIYGKCGWPSRWMGLREPDALRASLEELLDWDFSRIIMCHGTIVEKDGRDRLRAGFAWLLDR